MKRIVNWIIERAKRTPYFHLHHEDGALYMERYWLFQTRWLKARVHRLCTPDYDRHLHDHPWTFISIVLRGWYLEARPVSIDPCFASYGLNTEIVNRGLREAGSIALRRATDRHRIAQVAVGGVWTLVLTFPKRHWWGFFTPQGKVHWEHYESVHNTAPITTREVEHAPR